MPRAAARSTHFRAIVFVVVGAILVAASTTLLGNQAEAAITTAFTTRFQANVNGSILLRGNTNMVCPPAATGCTDGQNGVDNGGETLNNNGYVMQYADADSDNGAVTFNDSAATLTVPSGSTVLFAGLYWSGDPTAGTSGVAAPAAADKDKVLFRTPAATWQQVTASTLYTAGTINAYQGFADVTSLVSGAGNGVYGVADIQAGTGKDRYAGWALAIAYQNTAEDMRSLRIYNGFGVVSSSSTSVVIPAAGFQTPQSGTVHAKIGTVVYEGDLGKTGDTLQLDGQSMSDAANPANNFFNSTVSDAGALINSGRTPGNRNLMGVDIDQFDATGKLGYNVQNANLTLTTGGETFYPGVVTFTTDLYAPKLVADMTGTDVDGGDLLPGDEIEYRIDVRNDGTDTAVASVLSNAIPTHTTYVPGSLKIASVSKTDAAGDDTAKFAGNTVTFGVGANPNGTAGGELPYNATTYVTFRVKVDVDTPAGYPLVNLANSAYQADYTTMGITGVAGTTTMTVQQPKADLAAGLTVGPAAVQRSASPNTVTYTATVTNNGQDIEPAAVARLTLPAGVTAGTLPAGCTVSGQVVTCAVGPLVKNSSATVGIPATADATAAAVAQATLRVSGNGQDLVAANDSDTATLRVDSAPVAVADTAGTTNGAPVSIDVRSNDNDPDDPLSALAVTVTVAPTHGNAVAQSNGTVTYTPTLGWTGDDTFTYQIDDGLGGTDTATVTVTTANAAPVAHDDVVAIAPGAQAVVPVLTNDSDPNSNPIHVVSITQPQTGAGTATLAGDVVTYVPDTAFAGRADLTYTVEDSLGAQTVGHLYVDVANTRPSAADDQATAAYRGSVTVDVLGNDTDPNGDPLSISAVGPPDHGTAAIAAGKITYQAPAGFSGVATFSYTISDGNGGSNTAHVAVTVANAPPVAAAESVHTACNTAIRVAVLPDATDPNGDPLTVSGTSTPAHGTVVRNADGTITYTPVTAFSGPDAFDYTIDDGHGGTSTATVTVVVTNGVPTAGPDSVTVPANTTAVIDVLVNDTDPNNDPLTVTVDTPPQHGTVTVGTDGKITYVPVAGFHGTDSFHYTVDDAHGGTAGATVQAAVVNSTPVARPDSDSTDTDTALTVAVLGNDTDPNGDTLTVTAASGAGHGTVVHNSDGTVTYTPAAGFYGTDSFTYSITDPLGLTASSIVTVTVRNAPPIAVDDRFVVHPGTTAPLSLLLNDRDPNTGQALHVATLGPAGKGTATLAADGTVSYRPDPMTTGTDTFTYVLTDDLGLTDTATVTIVIDAAPIPVADTATTRTGTAVDIAVLADDTDAESEALTVTSVSTPAHGTAVIVGGKVRYTPAAGWTGADTFTYEVTDTMGNTATGTVDVQVGDALPVAQADVAAVLAGRSVTISVLGNDTDPNPGQTLTVTKAGTPAHGTAVIVGGQIRYTPAAGFTGTDTFTYAVSDSLGGTAQSTVTITVSATAVALPDQKTTPYRTAVTVPVLANDLDPDKSLKVTAVGSPDHGTAEIVTGGVRYTPPAGFSGVATFTYTGVDGAGTETTATVTVTVGVPPVVPDKTATTKADKAVTVKLPTVDENGVPVKVHSIGQPKHGTAVLNADGTVTYTAASGFAGTDSVPYEVVDADGNVASASINITVTGTVAGANKAPTATNDKATVAADHAIVIHPLVNDRDPNGDQLTVTKIGKPRHGTAVLNTDGTVTYAPDQSYSGGSDSFTYTISDGRGGTSTATITVSVNGTAAGDTTGDTSGGSSGNLAKTGLNVVGMAVAGVLALMVGGALYLGGTRGGIRVPALAAAFDRPGPGRHRPGRHRG